LLIGFFRKKRTLQTIGKPVLLKSSLGKSRQAKDDDQETGGRRRRRRRKRRGGGGGRGRGFSGGFGTGRLEQACSREEFRNYSTFSKVFLMQKSTLAVEAFAA
jgi:hypothetical protein